MMKQVFEIQNVKSSHSLGFMNDNFYCTKENTLLEYQTEDFTKKKEIPLSFEPDYIEFLNDNLMLLRDSKNGKGYKMDIEKGVCYIPQLVEKYSYGIDSKNLKGKKILSYSKDVFTKAEHVLFDFIKEELIWKREVESYIQVIGNCVISDDRSIIKKHDLFKGNILWEIAFDKSLDTSISNGIVFKNVLVLPLDNDILLGINTETGKLLWKIEECNNKNYVLDERDGKLKGVTAIGYFEVDIETGKYNRTLFMPIEKLDDPEVFDSQRDNFVLVGDHIVTTDWRRGVIAAFNTKTLKYDWTHHEKGVSFPGGMPMKYFDPYLFVMDNKKTLHIFKKEDNIV